MYICSPNFWSLEFGGRVLDVCDWVNAYPISQVPVNCIICIVRISDFLFVLCTPYNWYTFIGIGMELVWYGHGTGRYVRYAQ